MLMVVTYCMKSRYSKKCGNTCFLVTCLRHNFWLRLLTVARSRWQHWTSTEYATQSALNNGKNKKAVKPIRQLHCTETERRSEIKWQLPMHDNLDAALKHQKFHTRSLTCKKHAFWNWAALANSIAELYQESIVRLASHWKSTVSLHTRKLTGMHSHNKRKMLNDL